MSQPAGDLSPLLRELYRQSLIGQMVIAPDQSVLLWNGWLERMSGIDSATAVGSKLFELFPELANGRCQQAVAATLEQGSSSLLSQSLNRFPFPLYADEMARRKKHRLDQQIYVTPLTPQGWARHCLVQIFDVSAGAAREAQLRSQAFELRRNAYTDGLTNLPNRRRFDEAYMAEMRQAFRKGHPVSLLFIDIDFFKNYNDHYGHLQGDDCLHRVASIISASARRPTDLACRYGGEEFCLLYPETDLLTAGRLAEELQERIEAARIPHAASSISEWVTLSIGVASQHPTSDNEDSELVDLADSALYRAKRAGRNRVQLWDETTGANPAAPST